MIGCRGKIQEKGKYKKKKRLNLNVFNLFFKII